MKALVRPGTRAFVYAARGGSASASGPNQFDHAVMVGGAFFEIVSYRCRRRFAEASVVGGIGICPTRKKQFGGFNLSRPNSLPKRRIMLFPADTVRVRSRVQQKGDLVGISVVGGYTKLIASKRRTRVKSVQRSDDKYMQKHGNRHDTAENPEPSFDRGRYRAFQIQRYLIFLCVM